MVRRLAVDVKQGRAAWRGPALDPREHGGIVWPAERLRHRELEGPPAEHEVGPPFGVAEHVSPAALGRAEPVGGGGHLVLAAREPPGSKLLPGLAIMAGSWPHRHRVHLKCRQSVIPWRWDVPRIPTGLRPGLD